jgi:xanthine dehydrogenase accessory factor
MDIYQEMADRRRVGEAFALATIVRIKGASPRGVGAKMLVHTDGSISGTIGGGSFEKTVIEDCLQLLDSDEVHSLKRYSFAERGEDATGSCCGGEAEVFMEVSARPHRLILFGGGHVGRALVAVASRLNFAITVVDNRPDILKGYAPPVTTVLTDSEYRENLPTLGPDCYVVIVTQGHVGDGTVLAQVVDRGCAYVGMIGSRAKIARVYSTLKKAGVDPGLLEQVHAPIGLNIKAEGPHEIAVAIAGELIAARRGAL